MDVLLQEADRMGSLEFWLVFDPAALELQTVESGDLGSNALMKTSTPTPGRMWAGIADHEGISGSGSVVTVTFSLSTAAATPVVVHLEEVEAFHADTLLDIPLEAVPGSLTGNPEDSSHPTLNFR